MRRRRGARRFALWICCLCTACLATAAGSTRRDFRSADSSDSTDTYLSLSWDSSPFNLDSVTDNNLGLLAKSCSEQFCHAGINGLDLWISLEEVSSAGRIRRHACTHNLRARDLPKFLQNVYPHLFRDAEKHFLLCRSLVGSTWLEPPGPSAAIRCAMIYRAKPTRSFPGDFSPSI